MTARGINSSKKFQYKSWKLFYTWHYYEHIL